MTVKNFEIPDEITIQPDDYELPHHTPNWSRKHLEKMKQPVKVTRRQMEFFGERGVPMTDVEKFYGVDRLTLLRYYGIDYQKGEARTNVALRNRMVDIALNGTPKEATTLLIWLAKNRLGMGDNGPQEDEHNRRKELVEKMSDEELRAKALEMLGMKK